MTPEIKTKLCDLKIEALVLSQYAETFEEEIVVNSITYAIEQAELIFNNRDKEST